MRLKLSKIEDSGILEKERVVFRVLTSGAIGNYLISKTEKNGEGISAKISGTFWLPDKEVKKDDLVVIYSKAGINTSSTNIKGNTSHFFYWGQLAPLFNN